LGIFTWANGTSFSSTADSLAVAGHLDQDRGGVLALAAGDGQVNVPGRGVHLHVVDGDVGLVGAEGRPHLFAQVRDVHVGLAAGLGVAGVHGGDRGGLRVADEQQPVRAERQRRDGLDLRRALLEGVGGDGGGRDRAGGQGHRRGQKRDPGTHETVLREGEAGRARPATAYDGRFAGRVK
jgi:hypothetical protein